MRKRENGFTLAELLTVIAIIAVLVAVAIPLFAGHEERVEASTCESNCRSMKAELEIDILLDGEDPATVFSQIRGNYVCPSGGDYILDYNRVTGELRVLCTTHSKSTAITPDLINTIADVIANSAQGVVVRTNLDSGYAQLDPNSESLKLINAMAAAGYDISDGMWRLSGTTSALSSFVWTTADPATVQPGDKVYVIKYNFPTYANATYRGCFSVYACTVSAYTNNGYTYNILNTGSSTTFQELSTSKEVSVADKKDFSTMMDIYNAAVAGNGGSAIIPGSG